jgi:hypothetical protein
LIETAGIMGFFSAKLEALANGRIAFGDVEKSIWLALMGAKHELFSKADSPINILTCIERADIYLDTHAFKEKQRMLRDTYDWLSEYAHPNFMSNQSAFINKGRSFTFRHEGDLNENDMQLPSYASMGGRLFLILFDAMAERIVDGCLEK